MQKCGLPGQIKRGDGEQRWLLGCLGQGRHGGKGPGLGQKAQHPWDCGWRIGNGLWASQDGAGLCLLPL